MVTSISGSSQLLRSLYTQQANQKKPPSPEEKFAELDTDENGGLDATEIVSLTKEILSITGTEIDATDAISTYDTDGDESLSTSEVDVMMQELMLNANPVAQQSGLFQQAINSYQSNQSTDPLSKILNEMAARPMPKPPPSPEETFAELDTDNSETLSEAELGEFVDEIASMTGETMEVADVIETYDTDGDSELNQDELDTMMTEIMEQFGPPPNMAAGGSMRDALVSYLDNADDETITDLLELISGYASNISTDADTSSVDVDA
ncbi:EF-hand domain-containing protein [Desulfogranum japonicum]|uniref:EF-hand domain-containing protein n=1 Tax=Desulfogranum japonicum TaxID=231447 RepID=UPI0003FB1747|nr:EF-hand domain-containing protein [Desulfogranum japonicum]